MGSWAQGRPTCPRRKLWEGWRSLGHTYGCGCPRCFAPKVNKYLSFRKMEKSDYPHFCASPLPEAMVPSANSICKPRRQVRRAP